MTGTLLLIRNEKIVIVPICVERGEPVFLATSRTFTDGIKEHKLVITMLDSFGKTGRGNDSTGCVTLERP